jgi:hypothetical protein
LDLHPGAGRLELLLAIIQRFGTAPVRAQVIQQVQFAIPPQAPGV